MIESKDEIFPQMVTLFVDFGCMILCDALSIVIIKKHLSCSYVTCYFLTPYSGIAVVTKYHAYLNKAAVKSWTLA